jgi:type II secretion system protein N
VKLRTSFYIIAAAAAFCLVFPLLTILFVPSEQVKGALERGLETRGYIFHAEGFGKSLPFGFHARSVLLSDERGPLLKLNETSVRLKFLPLLIGRVTIGCRGKIGAGTLDAEIKPQTGYLSLHIKDVRLEDIPFFPTATGANMKGNLFVDGTFEGKGVKKSGTMKLEVKQAALRGIKIGETPLPDASYQTIRGMMRVAGGKGMLESLTFQGEGIYLRLHGDIPLSGSPASDPLHLSLELMPKPSFMENQKLIFLFLTKYQTTPGAYRIPISGTLAKPAIQ